VLTCLRVSIAQPRTEVGLAPEPAVSPRVRRRTDVIVAGLALALAGLVTAGLWPDPAGRAVSVNSGDQALFEWLLAYGAHAVTHGHDPFFTDLLNVPNGVNLAVNTSITVYAVVFAPLTFLLGPPVTFVVILTLNLAGTAYAWYWIFSRHLVGSAPAAALGGLFCGFAPHMVAHANSHLNWTALWIFPLIVWRVLRLREPGRWLRNGLVLGLLVAVAFSLAAEALFLTALACGLFLGVWALAATNRAAARAALPTFARGLAVTAAVAFALLAYPLWMHFFGPQRFAGTGFDTRIHSEDVAAYGAFPSRSLAGIAGLDTRLAENPTEENSFFGVPLLVLSVACLALLWRRGDPPRRSALRALAITAGTFAVLSFGPRARWRGEITHIPLPYTLLQRLPVFDAALPNRLALVTAPIIGLLLAWTAAELAGPRRESRRLRIGWGVAVAVALLPLVPVPLRTAERAPVPHFITSGAWRRYVSDGGTLTPAAPTLDVLPDGQRWQAYAFAARQGEFGISGGFFLGPGGPEGRGRIGPIRRPTEALLRGVAKTGVVPPIGPAERAAARDDLRYWRVEVVALPDRVFGAKWPVHVDALRTAVTLLLGPPERVDDVWLWRIR
jgi:hypothetical protein